MMARAEAEQDVPDETLHTEAELLDVLYEVLAQGGPAGGKPTTADVERFLHEHARSRKSTAEMLAFFQEHNLSTSPGAYGADPALAELASGLHRERGGPVSSMFPLDAEAQPPAPASALVPDESGPMRKALPASETQPLEESSTVRTRMEAATEAKAAKPQRAWMWALLAVAAVSLGGIARSYVRERDLQGDLKRAHLQLRATDHAVSALEQRAETLRGALLQSEAERAALVSRFEGFVGEAQRERAAEQDTLKRLLGKRYETLHAQALTLGGEAPMARPQARAEATKPAMP
jgi:hypothetical protein